MASPQTENGFTRIANEILEHLAFAGINGSEYRILLTVIRKTYGFNKTKDRISLSQFQKSTLMKRSHAVETIKELVHKRILLKENGVYRFNKNWEEWVVSKRIPVVHNSVLPSPQKHTKSSPQKHTHKRKKDINTKDSVPEQSSADTRLVIDLFKEMNPSYKQLFVRKPQHDSARRLWDREGYDKLQKVVAFLVVRRFDKFCPQISTPTQLEDKWGALEKYALGLKGSEIKNKANIAFS